MVQWVVYVVANVDSDVFLCMLVRFCRCIAEVENKIEVKIFACNVTDICKTAL